MKFVQKLFEAGYVLIAAMFFISAMTLVIFSLGELWGAIRPAQVVTTQARFVAVLECIGLLTIAVAALELGQTILEEEVQRSSSISAPTRVRRFLSRFIVVVVVALSIECLVAVFEFIHDSPELLPHAAAVGVAAAALLAAWGVFVRLNIAAETLEPEAMQDAKDEDDDVEASNESNEESSPPKSARRKSVHRRSANRKSTDRESPDAMPADTKATGGVVTPGRTG